MVVMLAVWGGRGFACQGYFVLLTLSRIDELAEISQNDQSQRMRGCMVVGVKCVTEREVRAGFVRLQRQTPTHRRAVGVGEVRCFQQSPNRTSCAKNNNNSDIPVCREVWFRGPDCRGRLGDGGGR